MRILAKIEAIAWLLVMAALVYVYYKFDGFDPV